MSDTDNMRSGAEAAATGGGKFQARIQTAGVGFFADEPVAAGGLGSGPTPYDLLCSALAACTAMTLRLYADRKGLPLRHVNVRVLHQRGPHDAKDRFAREIVLEGNLTADQRRRLLEIAQRCPVHNTLGRGSDVVSVLAEQPQAGRLEPEPTEQIEHVEHMRAACEE